MKIKTVTLTRFKRFTNLRLHGIPETARLVILAGPNGCGKSSLFEALHTWHRMSWRGQGGWDRTYHLKQTGEADLSWDQSTQVEFFDPQPISNDDRRKALYVRSAYRNESEFQVEQLNRTPPILEEQRVNRMIDNDATVARNYQRLASQGLEDLHEKGAPNTTFGEYRESSTGEVRDAIARLFPDLVLKSLGNPLTYGTFKFDKGGSRGFLYKNLSGGEKAAFDILLDIVVKKREFDDTVFLIDEPEAHMNARLQGTLLEEMYRLVPEKSQLWLATHSIGMMRRARDLWRSDPGRVVFFDLDGKNFDQAQTLEPVTPTRAFWAGVLKVALDDLSDLVAPHRVVICEGRPLGTGAGNVAIDANCYESIFADEFPDTQFLSGGNHHDVGNDRIALMEAITALVSGTHVVRLIDRDDLSDEQVAEKGQQGIKVLSRRHLESYLFDDEVLTALCHKHGKPDETPRVLADKEAALAAARSRGKPQDDVKSAAGDIYNTTKRHLNLTRCGADHASFMRDTLAPVVTRQMSVYQALKQDVFGEPT
jgi:predicted ATPase